MLASPAKQCSMVACAGLFAIAPDALSAQWLVTPTGSIVTDYTDNPRLLADSSFSTVGTVSELSASVRRRTEVSDFSLSPRLRSARYSDDDSLGSNDQYLNAGLQVVTERTQWAASAGFVRDTTLTSELQLTGIVQSNRRHEGITVSAGPTFTLSERANLGVQAFWLDNHYVDAVATGLVDYEYRALSLNSTYIWSDQSELTLKLQGGELHVPVFAAADKQDASLRLGWQYQPAPLWTVDLSAGPSFVKSETSSDHGAVFALATSRRGEHWTLTASAGRDLTPTGRGVVTRGDQVSLALDCQLAEHLAGRLSVAGNRNQDLLTEAGATPQTVEYGRVELGLNWQFAEYWTLSFAVSGATLDYESGADAAASYRTYLGLLWNGRPRFL